MTKSIAVDSLQLALIGALCYNEAAEAYQVMVEHQLFNSAELVLRSLLCQYSLDESRFAVL